MKTSLGTHLRRAALLATVAAATVALAPSCRGVVAGQAQDGVASLCDLLTRCYGSTAPECGDVVSRFDGAQPKTNDAFLGFMNANDCLATCSTAKMCWDHSPVCVDLQFPCAHTEDCCGFTKGLATCDGTSCCSPKGVLCDEGASTCCSGVPCFSPQVGQPATCGGVPPCTSAGDSCADDFECCSKQCGADGKCVEQKTCSNAGEPCAATSDCCPDTGLTCNAASGQIGQCAKENCEIGSACSPPTATDAAPLACDPASPDSCCDHPEFCVADVTGTHGVCVDLTKFSQLPAGFDCQTNADCCSGFCDLSSTTPVCSTVSPTCAKFDASCFVADDAACATQCVDGSDCCAQQCVNGRCTCGVSSCHSPFMAGPPLACDGGTPEEACAAQVCSYDASCCCTGWDSLCIEEAALEVGTSQKCQPASPNP